MTHDESVQLLGMTLAEYAASKKTHPQAVREEYRAMMRKGEGITLPEVTRRVDDGLDGLVKFCLPAGEFAGKALETETVIIPMVSYRGSNWRTLCVSSQVGCRMGCTFCETGRMGLLTNLLPGHIVRQRLVARLIRGDTTAREMEEKSTKIRAGMNARLVGPAALLGVVIERR